MEFSKKIEYTFPEETKKAIQEALDKYKGSVILHSRKSKNLELFSQA